MMLPENFLPVRFDDFPIPLKFFNIENWNKYLTGIIERENELS